jgi:5-hydroxyisourate hydrolase-like protein (transthyretin family)
MKILIYHSSDLDGHCSAAILNSAFKYDRLIGLDYGIEFNCDEIKDEDELTITDFSLKPFEKEIELYNRIKSLQIIDHHVEHIKYCQDNKLPIYSGTKYESACLLAWKFCKDGGIPKWLRLLSDYDTWNDLDKQLWENQIMPFQYGMRANETDPSTEKGLKFWNQFIEGNNFENGFTDCDEIILNNGQAIYNYIKIEYAKELEQCSFEIEFEGHSCLCINGDKGSIQFGDKINDYDLVLSFENVKNEFWNIGLYTCKDIDCCKLIKVLDSKGGGHQKASGCSLKDIDVLLKKKIESKDQLVKDYYTKAWYDKNLFENYVKHIQYMMKFEHNRKQLSKLEEERGNLHEALRQHIFDSNPGKYKDNICVELEEDTDNIIKFMLEVFHIDEGNYFSIIHRELQDDDGIYSSKPSSQEEYNKSLETTYDSDFINTINQYDKLAEQQIGKKPIIETTGNLFVKYIETNDAIYILGINSKSGKMERNDIEDMHNWIKKLEDKIKQGLKIYTSTNSNSEKLINNILKRNPSFKKETLGEEVFNEGSWTNIVIHASHNVNYMNSWFIFPDGKLHEIGDRPHINWVFDHAELVLKFIPNWGLLRSVIDETDEDKLDEILNDIESHNQIYMNKLLAAGFIRITFIDQEMNVECSSDKNLDVLDRLVIEYKPKKIYIDNIMTGSCKDISYEEFEDNDFKIKSSSHNYNIYIDGDGTLWENKYPEFGKPIIKNVEFVKKMKEKGWNLTLFTAALGSKNHTEKELLEHLQNIDCPISKVTNIKSPYTSIFIDDRALNVNYNKEWQEDIIEQIENIIEEHKEIKSSLEEEIEKALNEDYSNEDVENFLKKLMRNDTLLKETISEYSGIDNKAVIYHPMKERRQDQGRTL